MAPRKLLETEDTLWEKFATVTNELGEGNKNARGIIPLHPTGHWGGNDAEIEALARKAFAMGSLQVLRPVGWLESGMRKEDVDEFWVLDRIIAAAMDYNGDEYESLMKIFFRQWEKDLMPDGRSEKNKAQWVRWCELHLVRHHRTAKAERAVQVFHELGLLYPGWWKQIYAQLHGTAVSSANYLSPWDDRPSINIPEIDALNQTYNKVMRNVIPLKDQPAMRPQPSNRQPPKRGPRASRKQVTRKQPNASTTTSATYTPESETETEAPRQNKRVRTARFAEALEEVNAASADATNATETRESDNDSEKSFVPEDHYPDWIHEHDAMVGRPATTYPQLSHTIGFAPAADAWRNLKHRTFDDATRFNTDSNATTLVDSASQAAIPTTRRPRDTNDEPVALAPDHFTRLTTGSHRGVLYDIIESDLAMLSPDDAY